MGFATGQLMRAEINQIIPLMFQYVDSLILPYIKFLPQWLIDILDTQGVHALLDVTADLTKPFTSQYFYDELKVCLFSFAACSIV
jgi:hypothetical protein